MTQWYTLGGLFQRDSSLKPLQDQALKDLYQEPDQGPDQKFHANSEEAQDHLYFLRKLKVYNVDRKKNNFILQVIY